MKKYVYCYSAFLFLFDAVFGLTLQLSGLDFAYINHKYTLNCTVSGGDDIAFYFNNEDADPKRVGMVDKRNGLCYNGITNTVCTKGDCDCLQGKWYSWIINVPGSLQGATWRCVSHIHEVQSNDWTLSVAIPPSNVVINPSSEFPWRVGQKRSLKCVATNGYPALTSYLWKKNELFMSNGDIQTFSVLSASNDKENYTCFATNEYTVNIGVAVTSSVTLNVYYQPNITVSDEHITIREGEDLFTTCNSIGNPNPTVQWFYGSTPIESPSAAGQPKALQYKKIKRARTGLYTCKAIGIPNDLFSNKDIQITVEYSPDVNIILTQHTVIENTTNVRMICNATGEPTTYNFHGWRHHYKNILVRDTFDEGILTSDRQILTIPKVSYEDNGRYTCVVDNGVRDPNNILEQSNSTDLNVIASAQFIDGETIYASKTDHPLTVTLRYFSLQKQNVAKWVNISTGQTLTASSNINMTFTTKQVMANFHGKQIEVNGHQAVLHFKKFSQTLQGTYSLAVINKALNSSFGFRVQLSGPPEIPTDLVVVTSVNSITVNWKGGINGGHSQQFVLSYKDNSDDSWVTLPAIPESKINSYSHEIKELVPGHTYIIRIYSQNQQGLSKGNLTSTVSLQDPPEVPTTLITVASVNNINVNWVGGFNGGPSQTFFLSYKDNNDDSWTTLPAIPENKINKYNYEIKEILPEHTYNLHIYSRNEYGLSKGNLTKIVTLAETKRTDMAAIVGGVSGTIIVVILVSVGVVIYKRRRMFVKKNKDAMTSDKTRKDYEDLQSDKEETNVYDGVTSPAYENTADHSPTRQNDEDLQSDKGEPNIYEGVTSSAYENTTERRMDRNEYESLERKEETSTYQTIMTKEHDLIPMETVYINTTMAT